MGKSTYKRKDFSASVRRKEQLLGMDYNKANRKMKRNLLRYLFTKVHGSSCYRCGGEISQDEEFHIDHMDSWQTSSNPVKVFFDVTRLRMAHPHCNVKAQELGVRGNVRHKLRDKNGRYCTSGENKKPSVDAKAS